MAAKKKTKKRIGRPPKDGVKRQKEPNPIKTAPKGRGKGRPLKLTQELQDKMCAALRLGNYVETTCALVGVQKQAVYDWLRRGAREQIRRDEGKEANKKEEIFVNFSHSIQKAEAEAELRSLMTINDASKTQWQAAAWRLERKSYKRWGRKQAIEVTGEDGGAVKVKQTITIGGKVIEFE